jgi:hypothetical protein
VVAALALSPTTVIVWDPALPRARWRWPTTVEGALSRMSPPFGWLARRPTISFDSRIRAKTPRQATENYAFLCSVTGAFAMTCNQFPTAPSARPPRTRPRRACDGARPWRGQSVARGSSRNACPADV